MEMKAEVEHTKVLGQHHLDVQVLAAFLRRYYDLLMEGYLATPPPSIPMSCMYS